MRMMTGPFTGRGEAFALFDLILGAGAAVPPGVATYPILSVLGPGGAGKTTLLGQLCASRCTPSGPEPMSPPALLYAYLDFSLSHAPQSLGEILRALRGQLEVHGRPMGLDPRFPRFDLGCAASASAEPQWHAPSGHPRAEAVAWEFYRQQFPALRGSVRRAELFQRLRGMGPAIVKDLLPLALALDVRDFLARSPAPAVVFLDGFERLLGRADRCGSLLLEGLALAIAEQAAAASPFLLVLGSQVRLFDVALAGEAGDSLSEPASARYEQWRDRLPQEVGGLRLSDLVLPLWLADFRPQECWHYLLHYSVPGEEAPPLSLSDGPLRPLVASLWRSTRGHPLAFALSVEELRYARATGASFSAHGFARGRVSPDIAPGYEDRRIGDYLLECLLEPLAPEEQRDLYRCALPRQLDAGLIRTVLNLPTDIEARRRWDRYSSCAFARVLGEGQLVLHPLLRTLLLNGWMLDGVPGDDWRDMHRRLTALFTGHLLRSMEDPSLAFVPLAHLQRYTTTPPARGLVSSLAEVAYHTLALGEVAQVRSVTRLAWKLGAWEPFLQAVAEAPTVLMPRDIGSLASVALARAEGAHDARAREGGDVLDALVLYRWLLSACEQEEDTQGAVRARAAFGRAEELCRASST